MRLAGIYLSLLLVTILSACGGGSGDDNAAPEIMDNTQILETTSGTTTGETDTGLTDAGGTDAGGTDTAGTDTGGTGTGLVYVTPEGIAQCSVDDIKSRVDFDMRDYYIFYDQVPTLNLDDYDSGNALIQDLRVNPDIYSSVNDASTQTALFSAGRTQGFGFRFRPSTDNVVRFQGVQIGSPAYDAGILRGDELITLNDLPISDFTNEDLAQIFSPDNTEAISMSIRTGDEEPRTVSVTQSEFRWVTASAATRFTPNTDASLPTLGYLAIDVFLATTQDEIDAALQLLENDGGFDELIIDLRYNTGGVTSVAQYLGAVVGGEAVEGQVLLQNLWNDKYAAFNRTEIFEKVDKPLNSPRVFVLTTGSTASSSEIFINSLKPYIDVVVIGGVTGGKPFTSIPQTFCDKSINAMSSLRVNSAGVSVLGGIQPDCFIADAWNTQADSVEDPLVAGALFYASQGGCPTNIVADAGGLERKALAGPTFEPKVLANFAVGN